MASLLRARSFESFGGPLIFGIILAVQVALVLLMFVDWRLPVIAVVGVAMMSATLQWPLMGICLLVASRLISTGGLTFLKIGGLSLSLFEPVLLLTIGAFIFHIAFHRISILRTFPWRTPFVVLAMWIAIGVLWSSSRTAGLQDVVALGVVVASTTLILTFVRSYDDFLVVVKAWIAASFLIAFLSVSVNFSVGATEFEAAADGGRETGLGQQPNWFAMNLMFSILLCFSLAVLQRRAVWRIAYVLCGLFIFVAQLRSGSRGGFYAIAIAGLITGLFHPAMRAWIRRLAVVIAIIMTFFLLTETGSATAKAFFRISTNVSHIFGSSFRGQNWMACMGMFSDTYGVGMGAGGYPELIKDYSWYVYNSVYRYPHGIFWGIMAHQGAVGLFAFFWLVAAVIAMARRLIVWTRGSALSVFAWSMPATMLGYFMWSFFEFNVDEKPFWEFLALYTVLYLAVEKMVADGVDLPALPRSFMHAWQEQAADLEDGA
jgi:hypothetical protein